MFSEMNKPSGEKTGSRKATFIYTPNIQLTNFNIFIIINVEDAI